MFCRQIRCMQVRDYSEALELLLFSVDQSFPQRGVALLDFAFITHQLNMEKSGSFA